MHIKQQTLSFSHQQVLQALVMNISQIKGMYKVVIANALEHGDNDCFKMLCDELKSCAVSHPNYVRRCMGEKVLEAALKV